MMQQLYGSSHSYLQNLYDENGTPSHNCASHGPENYLQNLYAEASHSNPCPDPEASHGPENYLQNLYGSSHSYL